MNVVLWATPPLLPAGDELELHDSLGAERDLHAAVAILGRFGHEYADAFLQLREHCRAVHDLSEVRRADLLLALAYQHEVDRQLATGRLERLQRAEEGILGAFLIDGATSHADRAETRFLHQPSLERRGAPFLGDELLHVIHEIDGEGSACTGVQPPEHS